MLLIFCKAFNFVKYEVVLANLKHFGICGNGNSLTYNTMSGDTSCPLHAISILLSKYFWFFSHFS